VTEYVGAVVGAEPVVSGSTASSQLLGLLIFTEGESGLDDIGAVPVGIVVSSPSAASPPVPGEAHISHLAILLKKMLILMNQMRH